MDLEKLRQAWQSQSCATFEANPEQWLMVARVERWVYLFADLFIVAVFLSIGGWTLVSSVRDLARDWPWLIYCAGIAWVVGYILFNRWRRRRRAAHADESLLAHVEWSIRDIEHRMWLDRTSPWWYILPIALGCMIPPVLFFVMDYGERPLVGSLVALLFAEASFTFVFAFVYVVMRFAQRSARKSQLRELEGLRALRESLLNTDDETASDDETTC